MRFKHNGTVEHYGEGFGISGKTIEMDKIKSASPHL